MGLVSDQVSVVNDQPVGSLAGKEWDHVSRRDARSLASPVVIRARVRQPEGLKSKSKK
jgi:hypothetical protein